MKFNDITRIIERSHCPCPNSELGYPTYFKMSLQISCDFAHFNKAACPRYTAEKRKFSSTCEMTFKIEDSLCKSYIRDIKL